MISTARHFPTVFRAVVIAALAATALTGCVVEPEDTTWNDVGTFGWPTEIGATMHYKVSSRQFPDDTSLTAEIRAGKAEYEGMYRLYTYKENGVTPTLNQVHFRPTADTLFVENSLMHENGLSAKYALVAPLDRGHTWVADYQTDADGTRLPAMVATVIERYSYWKLEGRSYSNVVAVKYTPASISPQDDRQEWIRFYAQGIGVILTIKNRYPVSTYPTAAQPEEDNRVVLTETSVAH